MEWMEISVSSGEKNTGEEAGWAKPRGRRVPDPRYRSNGKKDRYLGERRTQGRKRSETASRRAKRRCQKKKKKELSGARRHGFFDLFVRI